MEYEGGYEVALKDINLMSDIRNFISVCRKRCRVGKISIFENLAVLLK